MSRLIIDIETIGEEYQTLDETTKESLTRWISKETTDEGERKRLTEDIKNELGFSPLTGEIVVLGLLDDEKGKGVIYFQDPSGTLKESEEDGFKYKPVSEKSMLEQFWQGAVEYQEFVTFNGRSFDIPFMLIRSAIHGVKPTRDLMSNRYLSSQRFNATHIDLFDQLTFYGAMRRKGNLHLWSRAFGIESPKAEGVTGDDVSRLFREGKSLEIARYNSRDLFATRELFHKWEDFLRF